MPKQKYSFWSEFEETTDSNGKKRYKCKYCSSEWAKNATRLQEHLNNCLARKATIESAEPEHESTTRQANKRKQTTLNNYMSSFTKQDQEELEYIGRCGGFAKKHLWSGLNQMPINWWNLLKSRYPLLSSVAIKVLSIPASSAASERNWSTYNFIHSKLRNRMVVDRAEKLVYIYWNIRILRELEVPLTVKELVKSGVRINELESDDEESDKEIDSDSNFETLTEYEENEFDLDIDELDDELVNDEN